MHRLIQSRLDDHVGGGHGLLADKLVEPFEHLGVPSQRVFGLENPMVLLGEVEEPGGDTSSLQGGKGPDTLGVGDSEV